MAHFSDELFNFLVMFQGFLPAAWKSESARMFAHRSHAHMKSAGNLCIVGEWHPQDRLHRRHRRANFAIKAHSPNTVAGRELNGSLSGSARFILPLTDYGNRSFFTKNRPLWASFITYEQLAIFESSRIAGSNIRTGCAVTGRYHHDHRRIIDEPHCRTVYHRRPWGLLSHNQRRIFTLARVASQIRRKARRFHFINGPQASVWPSSTVRRGAGHP